QREAGPAHQTAHRDTDGLQQPIHAPPPTFVEQRIHQAATCSQEQIQPSAQVQIVLRFELIPVAEQLAFPLAPPVAPCGSRQQPAHKSDERERGAGATGVRHF
ncbi:MAG TPA: hypothetical protein DC060_02180, partial [Gemmatimonadetes bacterium]|nr:hypothetical protein [Gemmatimonadota bacterium]